MPSDRPDGALSGLLYEYGRRLSAAENHVGVEGHPEVDGLTVLDSYDRNLHPWIHGRRPEDLVEKAQGWWPW